MPLRRRLALLGALLAVLLPVIAFASPDDASDTDRIDYFVLGFDATSVPVQSPAERAMSVGFVHGVGISDQSSELLFRAGYHVDDASAVNIHVVPIGVGWVFLPLRTIVRPMLQLELGGAVVARPDAAAKKTRFLWGMRGALGVHVALIGPVLLRGWVDWRWAQTPMFQSAGIPAEGMGYGAAILLRPGVPDEGLLDKLVTGRGLRGNKL